MFEGKWVEQQGYGEHGHTEDRQLFQSSVRHNHRVETQIDQIEVDQECPGKKLGDSVGGEPFQDGEPLEHRAQGGCDEPPEHRGETQKDQHPG